MSISSAFIVPHPPLIVPKVGNGQEKEIKKTIDSYHEVAKKIADLAPETIIVLTPHAVSYSDYFHIASGRGMQGSLKQFGSDDVIKATFDTELVQEVCHLCDKADFPAGASGEENQKMDHAVYVPLHFVNQYYKGYQLLCCSLSGLPLREHYQFGMILKQAVENLKRNAIVIASGDLSHKLKEYGPYGFAKEGPELDKALTNIMKSGNFIDFLNIDDNLRERGAECGLGSFVIMSGIIDKKAVNPRFMNYEGPFGVGYAVCMFDVMGDDENRNYLETYNKEQLHMMGGIREKEDDYVRLARMTLEHYILTERLMELPTMLSNELTDQEAGVFVSIKKEGKLRGCIGTIEPTQPNIALEIMYNAISSGTRDTRFSPITEEELPKLVYSVDVLSHAKPVDNREVLDPKRFGVIVSKGSKRGLLLPNLDGVDTVEEQIAIACQKAGIDCQGNYKLECFEVVRHK